MFVPLLLKLLVSITCEGEFTLILSNTLARGQGCDSTGTTAKTITPMGMFSN